MRFGLISMKNIWVYQCELVEDGSVWFFTGEGEETSARVEGKNVKCRRKRDLLKAVIQSIPTYVMSCFELPKQLCKDIHRLMERFWWSACGDSRKIHWLAWDRVCVSKAEGGMGFPSLPSFNLSFSLLCRDRWRLLVNPNSLVARATLTLLWLGCSRLRISR